MAIHQLANRLVTRIEWIAFDPPVIRQREERCGARPAAVLREALDPGLGHEIQQRRCRDQLTVSEEILVGEPREIGAACRDGARASISRRQPAGHDSEEVRFMIREQPFLFASKLAAQISRVCAGARCQIKDANVTIARQAVAERKRQRCGSRGGVGWFTQREPLCAKHGRVPLRSVRTCRPMSAGYRDGASPRLPAARARADRR